MQIQLYALRHISENKLVRIRFTENGPDAEFCNGTSASLTVYGDTIWVTDDLAVAERVLAESTPWYNSDHENPEHDYIGKLEIVPLVIGK